MVACGFTWGDAAAWVAAVGTVGTLIVSLRLLYRAERDRRLEQAKMMAAWMFQMEPTEGVGGKLTYRIHNGSTEPVYEVVLNAMCGVRGTFVRSLGTFGPGETRELEIRLPGYPRAYEYPPALSFVDSAGRRWLRDAQGKISTPSDDDLMRHQREDPASYESVEDHPTLRPTTLEESRGKTID